MSRILVVDGDPGIIELLRENLPEFFPSDICFFAADGKEVLEHFTRKGACLFDLLVTGIEMPFVDGMALTSAVKDVYPNLPVIIMSGSPEQEGHRADAFIAKPFDIKELVRIIRQLLTK